MLNVSGKPALTTLSLFLGKEVRRGAGLTWKGPGAAGSSWAVCWESPTGAGGSRLHFGDVLKTELTCV